MADGSETDFKINYNHYAVDRYIDGEGMKYMKADYFKEIENIMKNIKESTQQGENPLIWNREFVERFVNQIKHGKNESNSDVSDFVSYIISNNLDDYEVGIVDGKEVLLKKTNSSDLISEGKVVVPYEDSFELVWATHSRLAHCNPYILYKNLVTKYVINKFVSHAIYNVCYVCKAAGKPNICGCAYLIEMSKPDYGFDSILIYEDLGTKFTQLRPINQKSHETDIAMELFKLFTDFGPPANVEIWDKIIYTAFDHVKILLPNINIKLRCIEKDVAKTNFIGKKILDWIRENGTNWGVGCHMIQWDINNTKAPNEDTPYQKVFLRTPGKVTEDKDSEEITSA